MLATSIHEVTNNSHMTFTFGRLPPPVGSGVKSGLRFARPTTSMVSLASLCPMCTDIILNCVLEVVAKPDELVFVGALKVFGSRVCEEHY